MTPEGGGFELCAVAHLIRPWSRPARDLEQLRAGIASAPDSVIFHHAVQYLLRHPGAGEVPPDDFSAWVGGVVQDVETAERLSFAVHNQNTSSAATRAALLAVLEALPEKRRTARDAPGDSAFVFLSTTSLSFPLGVIARTAAEVVDALGSADPSVWFFHLIEEPWIHETRAPLLAWLDAAGDRRLCRWLEDAASSDLPIEKARSQMLARWRRSRIPRQLAEATGSPEDVRRAAGHDAVARFVRRRRADEPS